ncbi:hypothetical protein HK103_006706 [Boothiomyces macroporosus]|uniref:Clathrin/coatomer adaptor adaptin-like N-terminal domain-containing protein n=1 Tax=Boothiomyces macroporosus TaxID=261099 RepID=A0AAD5UDQ9_9FUNG|nr:hypothetical protein HK103_006706 [Boothiomyces macroporosus]
MSDSKFFQRGKVHELQSELQSDRKDPKYTKKKQVLKKVVANMTMGNDMSPLSNDILSCINIPDLEIKKMVYLFLVTYCKYKPEMAVAAINSITRDTSDENPLIRALAIRNMSNLPTERVLEALCVPLKKALNDKDPYVVKTAAIGVAKLFSYNEVLVRKEGFLDVLAGLLSHENSMVIANAVASLMDIASRSDSFEFKVDVGTANRLLTALDECSEWSQCFILDAIMTVTPDDPTDAELLADRISPRLQHSNSSVVVAAVRLILYLSNFVKKPEVMQNLLKKCGPPLVTLLHSKPEIQFVALRNIQLILQKHSTFLKNDIKVFFCKYNDPIYVKLTKLEIMIQLVDESNIFTVLAELKECAIKIEKSADKCIETLVDIIQTKVDYVVQEAIIVIKDIFRKYPNRFESVIRILCENLGSLEESEAKSSMIWIIGQYADRIENADELLDGFLETFKDDVPIVQLALLTAIVKLFIKRPSAGQKLVPRVLKYATEEVDNPDLRDRESDNLDPAVLSQLLYQVSTLSSLTYKPVKLNPQFAAKLLTLHLESSKILKIPPRIANPVSEAASVPVAPMINPYVADDFQNRNVMRQTNNIPASSSPIQMMFGDLPLDLFSTPNNGPIIDRSNSPEIDLYGLSLDQRNRNSIDSYGSTGSTSGGRYNNGLTLLNTTKPLTLGSNPNSSVPTSAYNPFGSVNPSVMSNMNMPPLSANTTTNASQYNPFGAVSNAIPIQNSMVAPIQTSPARLAGINTGLPAASPISPIRGHQTGPPLSAGVNPLSGGLNPPRMFSNPVSPGGITTNPNAVLDPFSKTSTGIVGGNETKELYSLSVSNGYVAPKLLYLPSAQGRGLEILGTCTFN